MAINYTHENDFGHLMTKEEFLECCEVGGFIDYDGFGRCATETHHDVNYNVIPSERKNIPEEVTHIIWYNK